MVSKYVLGFSLLGIGIFCQRCTPFGSAPKPVTFADSTNYKKGDTIQPLSPFDFRNGRWKLILRLDRLDADSLPSPLKGAQSLVLEDPTELSQIQRDWRFIYTEGDAATLTSQIILLQNDKPLFESAINLWSSPEGLQSRQFGWIRICREGDMRKYLSKFKKRD